MTRCAMKAVLARFVSLPRVLLAATILVGLYQIGFAYFSRSGAATRATREVKSAIGTCSSAAPTSTSAPGRARTSTARRSTRCSAAPPGPSAHG